MGRKESEQILSCLIKNFKLDKIGYKDRPHVSKYKSPFCELHALTCEYYICCVKFGSEVLFYDLSFREYDMTYDDF